MSFPVSPFHFAVTGKDDIAKVLTALYDWQVDELMAFIDGLVELKCPANMAKHLDAIRSGDHVKEYRWQLQGQLWVSGRAWVDAVSFDPRFPEHLRLAIVRVPRDEIAIRQLAVECEKANAEIEEILHDLQQKAA